MIFFFDARDHAIKSITFLDLKQLVANFSAIKTQNIFSWWAKLVQSLLSFVWTSSIVWNAIRTDVWTLYTRKKAILSKKENITGQKNHSFATSKVFDFKTSVNDLYKGMELKFCWWNRCIWNVQVLRNEIYGKFKIPPPPYNAINREQVWFYVGA